MVEAEDTVDVLVEVTEADHLQEVVTVEVLHLVEVTEADLLVEADTVETLKDEVKVDTAEALQKALLLVEAIVVVLHLVADTAEVQKVDTEVDHLQEVVTEKEANEDQRVDTVVLQEDLLVVDTAEVLLVDIDHMMTITQVVLLVETKEADIVVNNSKEGSEGPLFLALKWIFSILIFNELPVSIHTSPIHSLSDSLVGIFS